MSQDNASYYKCRCGGTGRRTGLKILRDLPPVPVRFRPSAPITNLFELQIQKSISKMVDFFVCEKI